MNVKQIKNKYYIYANAIEVAECTMPKFMAVMTYIKNGKKGRLPQLYTNIEGGFEIAEETLVWDDLFKMIKSPPPIEEKTVPVEKLPVAPEWNKLIEVIPDYRKYAFEVIMCFMASDKTTENPPWLGIIAPPSTGKTFLLKMFDHPDVSLLIDDFTDNALAAGKPNVDAADSKSMLDDAENRNLVLNDMSSVFSQKQEKVNKFIGGLTTAYGGTFVKYSPGTGAQRHNSNCTVIMGMTNRTYKKHRLHMTILGNRFLFLTFKRPKYLRHREDTRSFDLKKLRLETCALQQKINKMAKPTISDEVDDYLFEFVHRIILIRNIRWVSTWNELEGESRLYQELIELCMTRAKIHGRTEVSIGDVNFFKSLAYETIPYSNNVESIHNGAMITDNNKWTKYMLMNAIKMGLTKHTLTEVTVKAGISPPRTIIKKVYTWNDEYEIFIQDMLEHNMYRDDGEDLEEDEE